MWLNAGRERRLFQAVVLLAAVVPISAGAVGALQGPHMMRGFDGPIDLDSHFRYLSGLLLGIGLAFLWAIGRIDRRVELFRALCFIVVVGGLARLIGGFEHGFASGAHRFALVMELVVVPLLYLWLGRIERLVERG